MNNNFEVIFNPETGRIEIFSGQVFAPVLKEPVATVIEVLTTCRHCDQVFGELQGNAVNRCCNSCGDQLLPCIHCNEWFLPAHITDIAFCSSTCRASHDEELERVCRFCNESHGPRTWNDSCNCCQNCWLVGVDCRTCGWFCVPQLIGFEHHCSEGCQAADPNYYPPAFEVLEFQKRQVADAGQYITVEGIPSTRTFREILLTRGDSAHIHADSSVSLYLDSGRETLRGTLIGEDDFKITVRVYGPGGV